MIHEFDYRLYGKVVVLENSLSEGRTHISKAPRNHESLFFVTEGAMSCELNGESSIILPGQIGYIAKGSLDICKAHQCEMVRYITFNFNFGISPYDMQDQYLPARVLDTDSCSVDYGLLFHAALQAYIADTAAAKMICQGYLLQILGNLYNDWNTLQKNRRTIQKLRPAVLYLQQNFYNPNIRIESIGELCNMSNKNCRRLFMKVYGEHPHSFLQKLRLNQAKTLLLYTT